MTLTTFAELPKPECEMGYTEHQVIEIMGSNYDAFNHWMRGQTRSLCEGKRYNHDTREYEEACGGIAHGGITYSHDVDRFLRGLPIID